LLRGFPREEVGRGEKKDYKRRNNFSGGLKSKGEEGDRPRQVEHPAKRGRLNKAPGEERCNKRRDEDHTVGARKRGKEVTSRRGKNKKGTGKWHRKVRRFAQGWMT